MSDADTRLDDDGRANVEAIRLAREHARGARAGEASGTLPSELPERGVGDVATLHALAPHALGRAARLGAPIALAHLDPPTAAVGQAATWWNATLNQNLLHPDTAPFARAAEALAVRWLAPAFGMGGGHVVPGSTVANLTAIWAAREARGARRVVASEAAHLSVRKAAHILGLHFEAVPIDARGTLDADALPDLAGACLVLTASTTSVGAVDPLGLRGRAAWTHVDAAALDGIEGADSVADSAHKWLFQPKESALVLFHDAEEAHGAISFGGAYLAAPNVGLLSSHGAVAVPLLATLLA